MQCWVIKFVELLNKKNDTKNESNQHGLTH